MTLALSSADVADEIKTRLLGIRLTSGSETDIGRTVFMGRRKHPGDDEPPCVVVLEGEDDVDDTAGKRLNAQIKVRQTYVIDGFDVCDPNNPNDKAHAMIRDIKRSLFTKNNRMLDGKVFSVDYLGRDIGPRPDGVALVQARVIVAVTFVEDLSNP
jgi:hypothetical protein